MRDIKCIEYDKTNLTGTIIEASWLYNIARYYFMGYAIGIKAYRKKYEEEVSSLIKWRADFNA